MIARPVISMPFCQPTATRSSLMIGILVQNGVLVLTLSLVRRSSPGTVILSWDAVVISVPHSRVDKRGDDVDEEVDDGHDDGDKDHDALHGHEVTGLRYWDSMKPKPFHSKVVSVRTAPASIRRSACP